MVVNRAGKAIVTGYTQSFDFPVTEDAFQSIHGGSEPTRTSNAFITELVPNGTDLAYSTYLGGSGYPSDFGDYGTAIVLDSANDVYLTGIASSIDFPTTKGVFQQTDPTGSTGNVNAFIVKFDFGKHAVRLETTTQLVANTNLEKAGDTVTLTAYVRPTSGTGTPTGFVRFDADGVRLVTAPLNGSGEATTSWKSSRPGRFRIEAHYLGNEDYLRSSSDDLVETAIGPPARITIVSGSHQKTQAGAAFADPLVVIVKDVNNRPVSGAKVTFTGTGLQFSSPTATTNSRGEASVKATAEASGKLTAEASVSGVSAPAAFAFTATKVP
jgi:hypothetical protein